MVTEHNKRIVINYGWKGIIETTNMVVDKITVELNTDDGRKLTFWIDSEKNLDALIAFLQEIKDQI